MKSYFDIGAIDPTQPQPTLEYVANMSLAATYAKVRPALASECVEAAAAEAIRLGRFDLLAEAGEFLLQLNAVMGFRS